MYNNYISNNDDDLFDKDSSSQESIKSTNDIFKEIEDILSKSSENFSINHAEIKSKLVNSFNDSANRYIFNNDSFNRSIFDQLNSITNGLFAYRVYADILEESLSRRFVIVDFLRLLASDDKDNIMDFLTRKINIKTDKNFINTYIISTQEILDYVIRYNIEIYVNVCQKIERTPLESIVNRDIENTDLTLLSSDEYINKYFSIIRKEIGFDF